MNKNLKSLIALILIPYSAYGLDIYEGTTTQDFQQGGKFDLSTETGRYNFEKFSEEGEKSEINHKIELLKQEKKDTESALRSLEKLTQKEKDYAKLSAAVYGDSQIPDGWHAVSGFDKRNLEINSIKIGEGEPLTGVGSNSENGQNRKTITDKTDFHATLYESSEKKLVIAFEGTSSFGDAFDDLAHVFITPDQYKEADLFVKEIKAKFPGREIELTGHSLGGGLAQYASALNDLSATTFNPAKLHIPTLDGLWLKETSSFKIKNIVYGFDIVSKAGLAPLLGSTQNIGFTQGILDDHSITTITKYIDSEARLTEKLSSINQKLNQLQDPCTTQNYVCNPTLGNIISGINQGQNSHFGATNIYTGWGQPSNVVTQIPAVINPSNNSNTQLMTGLQQSSLSQNSTAYASTDWVVTSGNPAVHLSTGNSFGSITAPNNGMIAALNNANVVSTTMERTFFIPAGVKQVNVGMLANFVTNEYPTYVGSQYNDKSTIEIKTGSGNVYQATLFNKTLNSANFQTVTGLPSPLSSTGGQTGFEAINKTISVANGGALTITVKTTNVGDTAVPSATLINSTKVK